MTDTSDRDRETHFVRAGQRAVDDAMVRGIPVRAACGKTWVPSKNPDVYPLCTTCLQAICEGWAA